MSKDYFLWISPFKWVALIALLCYVIDRFPVFPIVEPLEFFFLAIGIFNVFMFLIFDYVVIKICKKKVVTVLIVELTICSALVLIAWLCGGSEPLYISIMLLPWILISLPLEFLEWLHCALI